jgi:hypothetical protein
LVKQPDPTETAPAEKPKGHGSGIRWRLVLWRWRVEEARDGLYQPTKSIHVQLVFAAKVVQDPGLGDPGRRVPVVVYQLHIAMAFGGRNA